MSSKTNNSKCNQKLMKFVEDYVEPFESKYLHFKLDHNTVNNKTQIYIVYNKTQDAVLGFIKWYGAWVQYTYVTADGCIMAKSCLNDINRFIDLLMFERKRTQ